MTTRRAFLASVPAVATAAVSAGAASPTPAAPASLHPIWRRVGDRWDRVRMFELRRGDVFRMFDPVVHPKSAAEIHRAESAPYRAPDGRWGIYAGVIDPAVPLGPLPEDPTLLLRGRAV